MTSDKAAALSIGTEAGIGVACKGAIVNVGEGVKGFSS